MRAIIICVSLLSVAYAADVVSTGPQAGVCHQPLAIGPCFGAFPRFFFNQETGRCDLFVYGGCQGNGNNFLTMDQCVSTCEGNSTLTTDSPPVVKKSDCDVPADTGPCRGYFVRFHHNPQTDDCEEFVYGGCHGNGNNFDTREECQAACPSSRPAVVSRSRVKPVVGQKGGAVNAVCLQEKVVGPCRAAIPRVFFNRQANRCESFVFGGCDGNANNFRTMAECEATCPSTANAPAAPEEVMPEVSDREGKTTGEEEDVCSQEVAVGPCYGYFPRFFHDRVTGRCEEFVYGGCHGNGNNFHSAGECEAVCGNSLSPVVGPRDEEDSKKKEIKDVKRICSMAADEGVCRAAFPMYYFNPSSGSCEEFIYGGCQGNENRFSSMEACAQFCAPIMQ